MKEMAPKMAAKINSRVHPFGERDQASENMVLIHLHVLPVLHGILN